jgi:CheY-like chemotaxis protein
MFDFPPRTTDPSTITPALSKAFRNRVGATSGLVLVIEDDPGVRHLTRRTLEAEGYQVLEAEDGVEGLRLVEEHANQLSLVVTDIEMPRLDGISVARTLAMKYPHIGVICMSGRLTETTFHAAISRPLPPFLAKPFSVDDLARTTSETIARFQQQGSLESQNTA